MFWCWLQELVCSCADIVPTDDAIQASEATLDEESAHQASDSTEQHAARHGNLDVWPPNPAAMFRTIATLLALADYQAGSIKQTHATNTTNNGNSCDGSVDDDEIDSYNQYFKQIGIHFQKPSHLLLDTQHDPCTADCNTSEVDGAPRNEYSLNDDFDCSASNANDYCDADNHAMQSSLCSSASTNQLPNAHDPYTQPDTELSNDCSIQINSIKHSASNNINDVEPKVDERPVPVQMRRKTPNTLNLSLPNTKMLNTSTGEISPKCVVSTKKRKISNLKRSYKQMSSTKYADRFSLNGITEECEYDSDVGKFNCKIDNAASDQLMSDTSSGSFEFSDETATIRTNSASSNEDQSLNDLNLTPKQRNHETVQSIESFNINNTDKIVTKRIEFFENMCGKPESEAELEPGLETDLESKPQENENAQVTTLNDVICLISFIFAVVFMYFFPLIC